MGALPRLKRKIDLKYRKGSTDDGKNCQYCVSFMPQCTFGYLGRHDSVTREPRCKIFGLEPSRRYRVRPDHTCDAQVRDDAKCWWIKQGATNA